MYYIIFIIYIYNIPTVDLINKWKTDFYVSKKLNFKTRYKKELMFCGQRDKYCWILLIQTLEQPSL